jgi:hypothetical protein
MAVKKNFYDSVQTAIETGSASFRGHWSKLMGRCSDGSRRRWSG